MTRRHILEQLTTAAVLERPGRRVRAGHEQHERRRIVRFRYVCRVPHVAVYCRSHNHELAGGLNTVSIDRQSVEIRLSLK
jgi:hypothetical protein